MPRVNRVLEEFGIHHKEYVVPPDVLAAIEEKKRKVATKNVTAVVKLKKRKGMAGPKALAKKLTTSTIVAIPAISSATSSAHASASAGEGSADGTGEDRANSVLEMDKPTFSAGARGGHGLEVWSSRSPRWLTRCPILWAAIPALRMRRPQVIGPLLRLKRQRPKKRVDVVQSQWRRCRMMKLTQSLQPGSRVLHTDSCSPPLVVVVWRSRCARCI
jgi:hypothetical protein